MSPRPKHDHAIMVPHTGTCDAGGGRGARVLTLIHWRRQALCQEATRFETIHLPSSVKLSDWFHRPNLCLLSSGLRISSRRRRRDFAPGYDADHQYWSDGRNLACCPRQHFFDHSLGRRRAVSPATIEAARYRCHTMHDELHVIERETCSVLVVGRAIRPTSAQPRRVSDVSHDFAMAHDLLI